jgi:hypothetical protein
MNPTESQYYNLGRQAHAQGFGIIACNVTDPVKAGFWRGAMLEEVERRVGDSDELN